MVNPIDCKCNGNLNIICDPLWEKGYFRANIKFSPQAHIAKNSTLLVIENHAFVSTFSRWSGVDLPLLALAVSLPSCGHRLRLYCVIEIPRAISRNNACVRVRTFRRIVLERKGLQTCGFRQRIKNVTHSGKRGVFTQKFEIALRI